MVDKLPKFQSSASYYLGTTKRVLWELKVDRAELLKMAIAITRARPINRNWYRYDAVWPAFPFRVYDCCCVGPSSQEPWPLDVPPSTCVALVLRAIAAAKSMSTGPITSDKATFDALGMQHGGCCGTHFLTQLTPMDAIRALEEDLIDQRFEWPQAGINWGRQEFKSCG